MKFAGIDVGAERHMVAMVGEEGEVLCRSSPFGEDASGYAHLFELLGPPEGCLVALEATGHYWRNLFVALLAKGYAVAVLNPLRTRRFAEEELQRTKTDAIDALGIARFAAQKRPPSAQLLDSATEDLRELARLRERLAEDFASRLRQLHREVDLGFPEFTRYVRTLESQLAATILSRYPTAASFQGVSVKKLARIIYYDGSHKVGEELARTLIEAAEKSVGTHHSEPYRLRIKYLCEDLDVLRRRLKDLARDIERKLDDHEVGKLLTTIDGVGPLTAACLIAELGDPARFRSAGAIASYVGVARLRQSGKKRFSGSPTIPFGNARLRKALWMVVLNAVRCNPWLRQYYERLRAAGKPGKVAVIAAMRKLLVAVWSVGTHRRPFVPIMPAPITKNV